MTKFSSDQRQPISVFVFDAYGTLFDVHSAVRRYSASIGPNANSLSNLWRQKQLEYAFVRALMREYVDFWTLTKQSLDTAMAMVGIDDMSLKEQLLAAYFQLDPFPEVPQILKSLRNSGAKLAILSNGSPDMLEGAVKASGLEGVFDAVLSVDTLKTYKCDPAVYESVGTHFRVFDNAISFQSSNRWDIAGARAFGFHSVWINRNGAPDEYRDFPPHAVLTDLSALESSIFQR